MTSMLPLSLLAGLGFGLVYFRVLRGTVDLLARRAGWWGPLGLTLGRLIAAITVFGVVAHFGPGPLLAAFLGFLAARVIAARVWRPTT